MTLEYQRTENALLRKSIVMVLILSGVALGVAIWLEKNSPSNAADRDEEEFLMMLAPHEETTPFPECRKDGCA